MPLKILAWSTLVCAALPVLEANATIYECTPQQVFVWGHGTLRSIPKSQLVEIYRFNDESEVLWLAVSPDVAEVPMQFKVVQKMSPDYDLVAMTTGFVNGHFIGNQTFTIRGWDKEAGLAYFLTDSERVSSGRCEVTDSD